MQWRKCWSIPALINYHCMIWDQYYIIIDHCMTIIVWSRISIISSLDDDLRSILCHQRGPADHWYHRSLPLLLAQPLDFLVGDIWICLETAFGFVSQNIYISPGFNFPYFRSSPLSISPAAEWHHIFLLNCPEKRTIFGAVCNSNRCMKSYLVEATKLGLFWVGETKMSIFVAFAKQRFVRQCARAAPVLTIELKLTSVHGIHKWPKMDNRSTISSSVSSLVISIFISISVSFLVISASKLTN